MQERTPNAQTGSKGSEAPLIDRAAAAGRRGAHHEPRRSAQQPVARHDRRAASRHCRARHRMRASRRSCSPPTGRSSAPATTSRSSPPTAPTPTRGSPSSPHTMTRCSAMMQAIVACPKPVIAAVQGTATAAGCQLVATCDLAVAAESAQFCTPGVNIGLFCSTPMVALVAQRRPQAGDGDAAAWARCCPPRRQPSTASSIASCRRTRVLAEALALAARSPRSRPPPSRSARPPSTRRPRCRCNEAYAYATKVMVENMMARDAAEGIGAFLEKRKPEWKGC